MSTLFDPTSRLVADMIQATAFRHRVLAANLANVETPGYQAKEVTFSNALAEAQALQGERPGDQPMVRSAVDVDPEGVSRRDGNTVDLDRQMVKLVQNTNWHNGLVQILTSRFAMMKTAIRGS